MGEERRRVGARTARAMAPSAHMVAMYLLAHMARWGPARGRLTAGRAGLGAGVVGACLRRAAGRPDGGRLPLAPWRGWPAARAAHQIAAVQRLRGGAEDDFFDGYDALGTKNYNEFSNNGHIYQIEYALESVKRGLTVVAVKGEKCLAFAVERRALQPLQNPTGMRKIHQIDAHVVATAAGLAADAPPIIDRARVEALTFRLNYEDCASIEYMARFVADVMLQCSLEKAVRPYGCSLVVMGLDLLTGSLVVPDPKPYPVPRIFVCDPSGTYKEWKAVSIGRSSETVMDYLRTNYDEYRQQLEGKDIETEERMLCEFALAGGICVCLCARECERK